DGRRRRQRRNHPQTQCHSHQAPPPAAGARRSDPVHCAFSRPVQFMRFVVILFLVLILGSLASALVFIVKDRGQNRTRAARALAWRVGLSIALFLMLMAGYYFGLITQRL
ncbi:MAG: hypothetical protein H6R12_331, partial [Proteobacteria bacterium]|nr:hypothetical protein [Pseudomonadota bacterium]